MTPITPAQARRLKRAVAALNDLLREVREDYPEACWYLVNDDLCLLSGDSHDGTGGRSVARRDRIMASEWLRHSGGGDW